MRRRRRLQPRAGSAAFEHATRRLLGSGGRTVKKCIYTTLDVAARLAVYKWRAAHSLVADRSLAAVVVGVGKVGFPIARKRGGRPTRGTSLYGGGEGGGGGGRGPRIPLPHTLRARCCCCCGGKSTLFVASCRPKGQRGVGAPHEKKGARREGETARATAPGRAAPSAGVRREPERGAP